MVPNSVTLINLERRNSRNRCSRNVGQKMFSAIYHLWRYWRGITPSKSVIVWHSPPPSFASENFTITWKRCKMDGGKLVLITNRKLYMSF